MTDMPVLSFPDLDAVEDGYTPMLAQTAPVPYPSIPARQINHTHPVQSQHVAQRT